MARLRFLHHADLVTAETVQYAQSLPAAARGSSQGFGPQRWSGRSLWSNMTI